MSLILRITTHLSSNVHYVLAVWQNLVHKVLWLYYHHFSLSTLTLAASTAWQTSDTEDVFFSYKITAKLISNVYIILAILCYFSGRIGNCSTNASFSMKINNELISNFRIGEVMMPRQKTINQRLQHMLVKDLFSLNWLVCALVWQNLVQTGTMVVHQFILATFCHFWPLATTRAKVEMTKQLGWALDEKWLAAIPSTFSMSVARTQTGSGPFLYQP